MVPRSVRSLPTEYNQRAMREGWWMPRSTKEMKRLHVGKNEMFMIGYDGPSPTPKSAWPLMAEHAMRYGL